MAWLSDWTYRREITVDNTNVDGDLTHFPIPIVLGTSVGQSNQDLSSIFDEVGANSKKIAITKADGTTQIYGEIEQWDNGSEKAVIWVSKSDLTIASASTTTLYIYYDSSKADNTTYIGDPGNRPEVWDSNFAAVFNFGEDSYSGTSGEVIDSTGTVTDAAVSGGTVSAGGAGLIGKAVSIDNSAGQIHGTLTSFDNPFAISIFSSVTDSYANATVADLGNYYDGGVGIWYNSGYGYFCKGVGYGYPGTHTSDWTHVVVSQDESGNFEELENLTSIYTATGSSSSASSITMGNRWKSSDGFSGLLQTVRYHKTVRTNSWIKADYHAQTNNLLTFGAEEEEQGTTITAELGSFVLTGTDASLIAGFIQADSGAFTITGTDVTLPQEGYDPFPVGDVTDPYAGCENCGTFDPNDPFNLDAVPDPFEDCNGECNSWRPWGDGYFYVTFPLSTYVTNIWSATTSQGNDPVGTLIAPTTDNGYYYRASNNPYQGETGATEPSWPTLFGETVVDGDIIWECYGYRTLTSDYMPENSRPGINYTRKFGDYILTLSSGYVLECWDAIPNLYGKKNANENVELVWRQHVRTLNGFHYDGIGDLMLSPANDVIFLAAEDGWNGDGVNWLNTDGSFNKYTRLRTKNQIGTRLQVSFSFVISHSATVMVIKTMRYWWDTVNTVTYEYDSPGIYNPIDESSISYPELEEYWPVPSNNLYSLTEASVTLLNDDRHSLVVLNDNGSVTSLDRIDTNIWTDNLKGASVKTSSAGKDVVKVERDYLLVGPTSGKRWQYLLCEPDTINPIGYAGQDGVSEITDPFEDCNEPDVCPEYDTGFWEPWGDGYYYVRFPLSTYVTRIWSAALNLGNGITGMLIAPTTDNGYYYRVYENVYPAVLGATEPTWPTIFGETVIDGDVTWECYGYRTLTSDYMNENSTPGIRNATKFGDNILTLSDDFVLECWDGIPNIDGKKNANENVGLVWRQHVRTFGGLQYDEYLALIVASANVIFLATNEYGWGDGVNWLNADTDCSFDKYTRLRTGLQSGVRLYNTSFVSSHIANTTVIKTMKELEEQTTNTLHTVTYEYDSPGVYNPTNDDIITYSGIETGAFKYNTLYSTTKATVVLSGDDRHSLVTLNGDSSVTSLSRINSTLWANLMGGQLLQKGKDVVKVEQDYLLVGPVDAAHFVLCEPDTINPITY